MVTAIHTAVPGRARYKVDGLRRSHDLKRYLEEELSRDGSVHLVSANPLTGNVLVFYETGRTPSEIGEALGRLVPSKERPDKNGDGDQPAPVPSIAARRRKGAGTSGAQKTSPRVLKIRLGEAERPSLSASGTFERQRRRFHSFTVTPAPASRRNLYGKPEALWPESSP